MYLLTYFTLLGFVISFATVVFLIKVVYVYEGFYNFGSPT